MFEQRLLGLSVGITFPFFFFFGVPFISGCGEFNFCDFNHAFSMLGVIHTFIHLFIQLCTVFGDCQFKLRFIFVVWKRGDQAFCLTSFVCHGRKKVKHGLKDTRVSK